jgi:hypothetical protein
LQICEKKGANCGWINYCFENACSSSLLQQAAKAFPEVSGEIKIIVLF